MQETNKNIEGKLMHYTNGTQNYCTVCIQVKRIANEDASNEDYCLQEVDETTLYVPDIHVYVPKIASSAG